MKGALSFKPAGRPDGSTSSQTASNVFSQFSYARQQQAAASSKHQETLISKPHNIDLTATGGHDAQPESMPQNTNHQELGPAQQHTNQQQLDPQQPQQAVKQAEAAEGWHIKTKPRAAQKTHTADNPQQSVDDAAKQVAGQQNTSYDVCTSPDGWTPMPRSFKRTAHVLQSPDSEEGTKTTETAADINVVADNPLTSNGRTHPESAAHVCKRLKRDDNNVEDAIMISDDDSPSNVNAKTIPAAAGGIKHVASSNSLASADSNAIQPSGVSLSIQGRDAVTQQIADNYNTAVRSNGVPPRPPPARLEGLTRNHSGSFSLGNGIGTLKLQSVVEKQQQAGQPMNRPTPTPTAPSSQPSSTSLFKTPPDTASKPAAIKRTQPAQAMQRKRRIIMEDDDEDSDNEGPKDEEQEAEDQMLALLAKVESISERLKALLNEQVPQDINKAGGQETSPGEQLQPTENTSAAQHQPSSHNNSQQQHLLVTREQIAEACGQGVANTLKGYQLLGINFLAVLSRSGTVGGAILADEMGLGKTAQTIVFLGVLQHAARMSWQSGSGPSPKPHLIICPVSLMENWQRELKRWCPNLRVVMYHGKDRDWLNDVLTYWNKKAKAIRRQKKEGSRPAGSDASENSESSDEDELLDDDEGLGFKLSKPSTGEFAPFDVMLTSYTMFERDSSDAKRDRTFLNSWPWSHLITDEAHALKNRNSIRVQKLMKIAVSCEHRILLTGTPLQNDVGELLNLLRFLMPSLFADVEGEQDDLIGQVGKDPQAAAQLAERVRRILAPFILRRLKSEVANQLTDKTHKLIQVDMVPEQAECYKEAIAKFKKEATSAPAKPTTDSVSAETSAITIPESDGEDNKDSKVAEPRRGRTTRSSAAASRSQLQSNKTNEKSKKGGKKQKAADSSPKGSDPSLADKTQEGSNAEQTKTSNDLEAAGNQGIALTDVDATTVVSKMSAQKVNNIFTHLRKVALHPLLVRRLYTESSLMEMARLSYARKLFGAQATMDMVTTEMSSWSDHALHEWSLSHKALNKYALKEDAVYCSGKVALLRTLLPELKSAGSKVLLFSQWTQVLDVMEWFLQQEQHTYVRLDGSTQAAERQALVDRFNDPNGSIFVFLLSTRAGGQGLNLTGADTVILHDVDFNPQVDRQAEDRCHRLGQTRPVTVYRLVTNDTVDQNIYNIAQRKLKLDAAIMEGVTMATETDSAETDQDSEMASDAVPGKRGKKAGSGKTNNDKQAGGAADTRQMGAILAALLKDL